MSKFIERDNWEDFLKEFSERNKERRARFNIFFSSGETVEEGEEGHLEKVSFGESDGKKSVVVSRTDRSGATEETMDDTIENVCGVAVQYETDGKRKHT